MGTVDFRCRVSGPAVPLPHVWEHTVGSCHAPLALRADWQTQLRRCHEELGFRYVRFHGLLCDDVGPLVTYKKQPVYSFYNTDLIFDFLHSIGMRPFVELSFMPETLASGPETVFHYRANVTPPKDYRQWANLIGKLVRHWVERYGLDEVRGWYFEVWNEPNLKSFWSGTQAQYFELYRHTVTAIKEVDDRLRVGGPSTAKNEWIAELLDFCAKNRLPADFVSTHHYPNDPLWSEAQDTEAELAGAERGILRTWAEECRRQAGDRPLLYTEWNISSNPRYPRQDEPYAAAFVVKTVLEVSHLVDAYSFWTFSDIFEENYFPSVPFHGGFGLLNLHGIPKPTYRAFELLRRLGTERFPVSGRHATVDAWLVRQRFGVTLVLTNHALPRQPIETQRVRVRLEGAPRPRTVSLERIDEGHANARRHWQEMGAPEYLSQRQVEQLQAASRLLAVPHPWREEDGAVVIEVEIPPHAVAAVSVEFAEPLAASRGGA
jgi:xylan 1,4-beta-xylosidase